MDRAWLEARKATLQARIDDLTRQQREIIANIHACTGAMQLCDEQLAADPSTPVLDLDALATSSTTAPDGVTLDVPPAGAA